MERRWGPPAGVAAILSIVLLLLPNFISPISGTGNAEILRSTDEHLSSVTVTGICQLIAFALLAAPLLYMFRAIRARSDRVRSQLIGLVVVAPLFLAVSSGLSIGARQEAAEHFVAGEAKSTLSGKEAGAECKSDLQEKGKKDFADEFEPSAGGTAMATCERTKTEDDEAENATNEASLAGIVSGLGLAGGIGLIVVFGYIGLWTMRTGLLSRFWGSLGVVSGLALALGPLAVVTMAWLVYVGLLLIGKVPGGKPPAWAAGEAVPWPTPGERAAAAMQGPDGLEAPSIPEPEMPQPAEPSEGGEGRPRKRKQRDRGESSDGPDGPDGADEG